MCELSLCCANEPDTQHTEHNAKATKNKQTNHTKKQQLRPTARSLRNAKTMQ